MFSDRKDAGEQLGVALEKYKNQNVVVIGIPRGGVVTAYYVAKHLNAEMTVVITRKLGYPQNPEAAFGAVAEDGSLYISDDARESLSKETIRQVLDQQKLEIWRRVKKLRNGKPLPDLKGRTVIITDDGIATGATLFATIELCKKKKAARIIVAAPVSGERMETILQAKVDEVIILQKPSFYHAVSQAYYDFMNVSDEEALSFIEKYERERKHSSALG